MRIRQAFCHRFPVLVTCAEAPSGRPATTSAGWDPPVPAERDYREDRGEPEHDRTAARTTRRGADERTGRAPTSLLDQAPRRYGGAYTGDGELVRRWSKRARRWSRTLPFRCTNDSGVHRSCAAPEGAERAALRGGPQRAHGGRGRNLLGSGDLVQAPPLLGQVFAALAELLRLR
ncbi:hypothetical protein [Nocardia cyriacigeorgica]|uniref:hypothetical protein n=1 Tax=Nocardia cyriacigeorgica TaxID=135487 RepID=UPI0024552D29|nr:hypothetical protein [Nocardia cyriacigeorgica]